MFVRSLVLVSAGAILLAGCSKKTTSTAETLPPPPADTAAATPTTPPPSRPAANGPTAGSHADFLASVSSDRVFFDTDEFGIDAQDQAVLRSQAQWLSRYPSKKITIEGHCDERGSREYNIALGERRANAAKNFLASLGVDAARITTISYGKERPVATASDEAAWAQNRRAVTITID